MREVPQNVPPENSVITTRTYEKDSQTFPETVGELDFTFCVKKKKRKMETTGLIDNNEIKIQ